MSPGVPPWSRRPASTSAYPRSGRLHASANLRVLCRCLASEERRRNCKVLDFDRQWDSDPGAT